MNQKTKATIDYIAHVIGYAFLLCAFLYVINLTDGNDDAPVEDHVGTTEAISIEQANIDSIKKHSKPSPNKAEDDVQVINEAKEDASIQKPEFTSWANTEIMINEGSNKTLGFLRPFSHNKTFKSINGDVYASDYLVATLDKKQFSLKKAKELAAKYNAKVVGAYPDFQWVQIAFDFKNLAEIEAMASTLLSDELVISVTIDTINY